VVREGLIVYGLLRARSSYPSGKAQSVVGELKNKAKKGIGETRGVRQYCSWEEDEIFYHRGGNRRLENQKRGKTQTLQKKGMRPSLRVGFCFTRDMGCKGTGTQIGSEEVVSFPSREGGRNT